MEVKVTGQLKTIPAGWRAIDLLSKYLSLRVVKSTDNRVYEKMTKTHYGVTRKLIFTIGMDYGS